MAISQTASVSCSVKKWTDNSIENIEDHLLDEVAVALVYNGISHVVMMITPLDLQDFAVGFSLTEGIIQVQSEIIDIEIVEQPQGIEVLLTLTARRFAELKQTRRNLTGRTGCGLCGAESLQQAIRPIPALTEFKTLSDEAIQLALTQLNDFQPLQKLTGACHGAAWCDLAGNIQCVKEDVGRHNALDKLIGHLHSKKIDSQQIDLNQGFVVVSSRASYEMVQKVASVGIGALVSVSAPTAFAVKIAEQTKLTLVGFARPNRHSRYTPY
ncbi:formate dehydrogenase accessory sulfurtransferase FdhD [Paraglaciecola aquimarina]|uniref:Sulfur carrier protein FdhD n=1 Tax=Paraglaciecola algarum TaxID=3050085 RepID=A0ABS9D312_9ALTE|nr:formate dehydrogenase accessory sulfurtransferase FdhD [Paraglaciecola sp. G1-23]MCF2947300.1 formate dehydrogenase accessory sulfurtransferase FdhD [Paraglaciecola sp. G1-23]